MRVIAGVANYTVDFEPDEVMWSELPYLKAVMTGEMEYLDFRADNETYDFVRLFLTATPRPNELVAANIKFALGHIRKFRNAIERGE